MRLLNGLLAFAIGASAAHAQTKTAQVVVHGKSVQLLPSNAIFVTGLGEVTSFFSTYNGATGAFRIDTAKGGLVSGELRPRAGTNGLYEGGYAQATPLVLWDYGSYTVSIPLSDSDSNGIPDVIQYDRDGNFLATGSGFSVPAGLPFSMSVRFTRAANSATGSYFATTQNALGQPSTVTGGYSLLSYLGTVAYSRGATNAMNLSITGLFQGGISVTGSTVYTTSNVDSLSYSGRVQG